MPAKYLSWLPGTKDAIASILAFDPFQANLHELQMKDEQLQMLQCYMTKNYRPANHSRSDKNYFQALARRAFQDKNKVVWVRLTDFNYPRTALYLPEKYCKEAMFETHGSIFGGLNATHKTYLKISTS